MSTERTPDAQKDQAVLNKIQRQISKIDHLKKFEAAFKAGKRIIVGPGLRMRIAKEARR